MCVCVCVQVKQEVTFVSSCSVSQTWEEFDFFFFFYYIYLNVLVYFSFKYLVEGSLCKKCQNLKQNYNNSCCWIISSLAQLCLETCRRQICCFLSTWVSILVFWCLIAAQFCPLQDGHCANASDSLDASASFYLWWRWWSVCGHVSQMILSLDILFSSQSQWN